MDPALLPAIYPHPRLTAAYYAELAGAHARVELARGHILAEFGRVSDHYTLIERGLVRKYARSSGGDEVTTRFFAAGEFSIVISSFFRRTPSLERAVAVTDVAGWSVCFDDFQRLFASIEGFGAWGRDWMSGQLFAAEQYGLRLRTASAKERYLELVTERPDVLRQASLKHVASYLGVTDTSLSRIRKEIAARDEKLPEDKSAPGPSR